jgi:WD40 repeat protein
MKEKGKYILSDWVENEDKNVDAGAGVDYGKNRLNDKSTNIKPHPVTSIDFSPSGRVLFTACGGINRVVGWDLLTGNISAVLDAHDQQVSAVRTAPDGSSLVTSSWDQLVKVWA